jgi:hypothetical protein
MDKYEMTRADVLRTWKTRMDWYRDPHLTNVARVTTSVLFWREQALRSLGIID